MIYIFINNEKFIFGHGPNMDRIFLETVKKGWEVLLSP